MAGRLLYPLFRIHKGPNIICSECLNIERPKSKLRQNLNGRGFGIQTVRISDVRAFETTPQLSEIQTGHSTIIQHLYANF